MTGRVMWVATDYSVPKPVVVVITFPRAIRLMALVHVNQAGLERTVVSNVRKVSSALIVKSVANV